MKQDIWGPDPSDKVSELTRELRRLREVIERLYCTVMGKRRDSVFSEAVRELERRMTLERSAAQADLLSVTNDLMSLAEPLYLGLPEARRKQLLDFITSAAVILSRETKAREEAERRIIRRSVADGTLVSGMLDSEGEFMSVSLEEIEHAVTRERLSCRKDLEDGSWDPMD